MSVQQLEKTNGIDVNTLKQMISEVAQEPGKGEIKFHVTSAWKGGTRSETQVETVHLGGLPIERNFSIPIDEPEQLLGTNTAPNPQEMLMAAMNACVLATYVIGCAVKGITLERLEIETEGELDLRGFMGLDESVKPGYEEIHFTVHIKSNGTPEQLQEIHQNVMKTSPNFYNISQPVRLVPQLVLE